VQIYQCTAPILTFSIAHLIALLEKVLLKG